MEKHRATTVSLQKREAYFLVMLAVLAGFLFFFDARAPITSVETQFVERSMHGLSIIPASCPSSPHYSGECSGTGSTGGEGGSVSYPPPLPPIDGACPLGYVLVGGQCWFISCPLGYRLQGSQCVPVEGYTGEPGQCTNTYFCIGSDLYQRSAQCSESFVQACAYGCAGGGCLAVPQGEGNITVSPALVRSGDTTTVSWTTSDMLENSCTVTENNPDINDGGSGPSGSFTSSPIRQKTGYTLTCLRQDESVFTDNATVNVIPVFQEQ